jgi:hypothetical protein
VEPPFVTTNLGYNIFLFLFLVLKITKNADFGEANVSVKSVESLAVLWRPRSDHPDSSALNLAQQGHLSLSVVAYFKTLSLNWL